MTMLSQPTPINQLTAGGAFPHADCGEACALSNLIDSGHHDSIAQVENADTTDPKASYTTTVGIARAEGILGTPAHAVAIAGECDAALARKHRIMVEIPSDHMGNPMPGSALGHFILVYGFDGVSYRYMNPLGGRLMTISAAMLIECERERGLRAMEVDVVMNADQGLPIPAPPAPAPAPTPPPPGPWPYGTQTSFDVTVMSTAYVFREPMIDRLHTVYAGNRFHIDGYKYGPAVWDNSAHQNDTRWYHIYNYGWVASALVFGNAPGSHP